MRQIPPCTPPSRKRARSSMSWPGGGRRWSVSPGPSPSTSWSYVDQTRAAPTYTLRVKCSKGTYVRTLCHDIGQALGCGGNALAPCAGPGRRAFPWARR
ncbi:MAG: hypothetical protein ACLUNZ_00645 [Evtepia sp.]